MTHQVMIIEDEANLRWAVTRGLQMLPNIEVIACGSGEEALEHLIQHIPDLIVADLNLPGISGLDLIEDLNARQVQVPVLVTTAYCSAYRRQLDQLFGLTILEKPVPLKKLQRLVLDRLAAHTFDDVTQPFQLADYLQLAGLVRRTLLIEIELEEGSGRVEVVAGETWNAYCNGRQGLEALRLLLDAPSPHISFEQLPKPPPTRQLHDGIEALLLEIAQCQDEARHGAGTVEAQPEHNGSHFDELFSQAMSTYLQRDYQGALALMERCAVLRPDDPRVTLNIDRIRSRASQT